MGEAQDIRDQMKDLIRIQVAGGFSPEEEIVEYAVGSYQDDLPVEDLIPLARQLTAEAIERHLAGQTDWPEVTDWDRLNAAFEELSESGIVAKHNGVCCQTCAVHEAYQEMTRLIEQGRDIRGYTFYHEQDTESAVDNGAVCLAYGSTKRWKWSKLSIGKEVARVVKSHGLRVDWNGSLKRRITVFLDWKRRWVV